LTSQEEINDYLDEINKDPRFYHIENEGIPGKEQFHAIKFKQVNLNVDKTEDGKFVEAEQSNFFPILPEYLAFQGFVTPKMESLLVNSEALDQANTLRMTNMLIPLLQGQMETNAKIAKQLLISFNKDQRDWLPQQWIDFLAGKKQPAAPAGPMEAAMKAAQGDNPPPAAPTSAETAVPPNQVNNPPQPENNAYTT
jgi:hypothetical protein